MKRAAVIRESGTATGTGQFAAIQAVALALGALRLRRDRGFLGEIRIDRNRHPASVANPLVQLLVRRV